MNISHLHDSKFMQNYGIFCAIIPSLNDRQGLYPTFCRITPGDKTKKHSHFESEIFYIISGQGSMMIDNEIEKVSAGNLIHIPAFAQHELQNISQEDLIFLSVYSEDINIPVLPNSVVITSAPPTPNGALHLGHIGGPYLASDILARYLRLRSVSVKTHCGTDDHQNYVAAKAIKLQISVDDFRNQMQARIKHSFENMNIQFTNFITPAHDLAYRQNIVDFVKRAIALNVIEEELIELPYCAHCELLLVDAWIRGNCPFCFEESHGVCENCGMVASSYDLLNTICLGCKNHPIRKLTSVYTFDLKKYFPLIADELNKLTLSPQLQQLIKYVSNKSTYKILLTYPDNKNCGIHIPESNQLIHVWFEMAAHYEQYALSDDYWVHSFGFDNSFHYLIFIPTLSRAMHPAAKLPNSILSNQFLQLDGYKFSTSREHAIWADEFSENRDHLRLYLSLFRPENHTTDFSLESFKKFSQDLEQQFSVLNEKASMIKNVTHNQIHSRTLIECNRATRNMEYFLSPSTLNLRQASREILSFLDSCIHSNEADSNAKLMLHTLAMLMSPVLPQESIRMMNSLEVTPHEWIRDWSHLYASI